MGQYGPTLLILLLVIAIMALGALRLFGKDHTGTASAAREEWVGVLACYGRDGYRAECLDVTSEEQLLRYSLTGTNARMQLTLTRFDAGRTPELALTLSLSAGDRGERQLRLRPGNFVLEVVAEGGRWQVGVQELSVATLEPPATLAFDRGPMDG